MTEYIDAVDKALQYGFIFRDKGIELICDLFTEGSPIRVDVLFDSSCGKGRAI